MHDPTLLLAPGARAALARRRYDLDVPLLTELVTRRGALLRERDGLRAELNRGRGTHDPGARAELRASKERLGKLEEEHRACDAALHDVLLTVPNLPSAEVPDGGPADPPVVVSTWGEPPVLDGPPRDHIDLGTAAGIIDQNRAAKLSGARFTVTRGAGARLERAVATFLLDLHTREHGYLEYGLPHLVSPATMTATGQLPKFAADLFVTTAAGRELLLIPTAEVPLINLYRDEIIDERELPVAVTAYTPCYRSEAGSYGRDTRGLIRLHQFEKVELVRLCHPDRAAGELRILLGHAEEGLRRLGLHYRVVQLRAADLGFAARQTYDIEVWLPGQGSYREISSCSDCGTFQGRRAGIRVLQKDRRKVPAATLNGSALPVGRTVVAILEQYQRPDGSIEIPEVLRPYTGFAAIGADGAPLL